MPIYSYTARDEAGKIKTDITEALNEAALIEKLHAQGLFIVQVNEAVQNIKEQSSSKTVTTKFSHKKVKLQDLVVLTRQLATMLEAGVALLRSLDIVIYQIQSQRLYEILKQVRADVESGQPFSKSLAKHPKVFGQFWVALIEVGEASGAMPTVLNKLANTLEEQAAFRSTIISALIYPAILCVACVGTVIFFALFVAPRFEEVFTTMHAPLPVMTKALLSIFKFIKINLLYILAVFTVVILIAKAYFKTPTGSLHLERFIFGLPKIGDIYKLIIMERFTSQMAVLISSGVPILLSLEIVGRLVDNRTCAILVSQVHEQVREGKGLAQAMANEEFFPLMAVQMVNVGEETGELAKLLNHTAIFYKNSVEIFMKRFGVIFEPFMLVLMATVIGTVVISIFLPLFKLGQGGGISPS